MNYYARNRKTDNQYQLLETHLLETSELAGLLYGKDFKIPELLQPARHDLVKNAKSWQEQLQL